MSDVSPAKVSGFLRVEVISLALAIMFQTATGVWQLSQLAARVAALETKATAASHQGEDIARIDERTKSMDEAVQRIERQLEARTAATH